MNPSYYKYCMVPQCKSTSIKTPKKLFIFVPSKAEVRKKWLTLARRNDANSLSSISRMFFCEDHFDLPTDVDNYMEYHIMGSVSKVRLRPGCIPTKFACQIDRQKRTGDTTERPYFVKKRRQELIKQSEKDLQERSITKKHLELGEASLSGSNVTQCPPSNSKCAPKLVTKNDRESLPPVIKDERAPDMKDDRVPDLKDDRVLDMKDDRVPDMKDDRIPDMKDDKSPVNKRRKGEAVTSEADGAPFAMRATKCVCCLERDAEEQLWAPRAHLGSYGHLVKLLFAIDFPLPDGSKVIGICTRCAIDLDSAMELGARILRAHDKLTRTNWLTDRTRSVEVSDDDEATRSNDEVLEDLNESVYTETLKTEYDIDIEEHELVGLSEPSAEPETTAAETSDVRRKPKARAKPVTRTKTKSKSVKVGEASSSSDSLPLAAVGQTAEGTRTRTGQRHFNSHSLQFIASLKTADHTNGSNAGPNQRVDNVEIKVEPQDIKLEPDPLGEADPLEQFEPLSWSWLH